MKYGVIVCPGCGKAKGVGTEKKTTTCPCGREIKLARIKYQYETDSPHELAEAVAQANALIAGGEKLQKEKRSRKKDPYTMISEKAKRIKDPLERMGLVASELTKMKDEFTEDDLRRVVMLLGKSSAKDILARLQEHNIVYESSDGKYRAV